MNINRNSTFGYRTAFLAAALLATVTAADGQTRPTYEFKIISMGSAGAPLTVQLLNVATGQPVTNADVTMQHMVSHGIKRVRVNQHVFLALEPDGRGDYVCSRGPLPAGEKLILRGQVPGDTSATWLTVTAAT